LVTASGALATIGIGTADLSGAAVVRQAREAGVASGVTAMQGRAYMSRRRACRAASTRRAPW
jgi:hypothetical protein